MERVVVMASEISINPSLHQMTQIFRFTITYDKDKFNDEKIALC